MNAAIDAVLQGDPLAGNVGRQTSTGITIDAPAASRVTLRNLTVRNFATGIDIVANSHVTLDEVRLNGNLDHGIRVSGDARVAIHHSEVTATGFRNGTGVPTVPNPGIGILFTDTSRGQIADSFVNGSFAAGVREQSNATVTLIDVRTFDNVPNLQGF